MLSWPRHCGSTLAAATNLSSSKTPQKGHRAQRFQVKQGCNVLPHLQASLSYQNAVQITPVALVVKHIAFQSVLFYQFPKREGFHYVLIDEYFFIVED